MPGKGGTFLDRTKGQEHRKHSSDFFHLNWAGQPMKPGDGYGGFKAEEEKAERESLRRSLQLLPERAREQVSGYWAKLKQDPIAYARHLEKMKIGREKWRKKHAKKSTVER